MNLKRNVNRIFKASAVMLLMCSCQDVNIPVQTNSVSVPRTYKHFDFNNKGSVTPAAFSLKLNFKSEFGIKAKTIENDLKSLKFCLIESDTGVHPAGGINLIPASNFFNYNVTANAVSLSFTNIRANNTGKSYYIAVAAYDGLNGSGSNITNNTGENSENGRVTIEGNEGNFYVTAGGGDTSGSNAGSVKVYPVTYELSATEPLTVNVKLMD